MRIFKALDLIPQGIDLIGAVFCYFLDRRRYIDLLAVFKDLDLLLGKSDKSARRTLRFSRCGRGRISRKARSDLFFRY